MPEGPEIRLAADRIARALVGKELVDVRLTLPAVRRFRKKLVGAQVTAIDTRGKAMLTRFDNGLTLYSHNQLYGRWYVTRRNSTPATRRSLRVALHTNAHSAWLYSATDVEMLDDAGIAAHPFLGKLGPDVLDPCLKPAAVAGRLDSDEFRRRSLASLYLDQAFLAGIGNYLRSEILFTARLNPLAKSAELDSPQRMRLARATLTVSRRAYRQRGVTVPRALAARLKRAGQRYGQYRHWVFARNAKACRECGHPITRLTVSSRAVFVCTTCQDEP